jgi:hypothetical protein
LRLLARFLEGEPVSVLGARRAAHFPSLALVVNSNHGQYRSNSRREENPTEKAIHCNLPKFADFLKDTTGGMTCE